MKYAGSTWAGLGLLVAVVAGGWVSSCASTTLALAPAEAEVGVGDLLRLHVEVGSDGPALSCFTFSVEFDPAVLRFEGASEGALFAGSSDPTFFSEDTDGLGRPRANGCVLGIGTSVAVPGEIALLDFTVVGEGAAPVVLQDVILRDVDREAIAGVHVLAATVVAGATSAHALDTTTRILVHPNPASAVVTFALRGADPGPSAAVLDIVDLAGRRVCRLAWPGGDAVLRWDGTDLRGRTVAAGLYFVTLRGHGLELSSRLLRIDG